MSTLTNLLLFSIVLINLYLLSASRLGTAVKALAAQGVALALLPLSLHGLQLSVHTILIPVITLVVKGVAIPLLLNRAMREVEVNREVAPYIGQTASLLWGGLFLIISFWVSARLVLPLGVHSRIWVPVALSGVMMGLFLIIARRKAITQVMGYLVLENGIYTFALALVLKMPYLIEMGVLLDVFIAVFIMGIMLNHIKETFEDFDTEHLTTLHD